MLWVEHVKVTGRREAANVASVGAEAGRGHGWKPKSHLLGVRHVGVVGVLLWRKKSDRVGGVVPQSVVVAVAGILKSERILKSLLLLRNSVG